MTSAGTGLILGIESSCDETAVALVQQGRTVLADVVLSQANEHAAWGGVVPEIAGRGHLRDILPAIKSCLQKSEVAPADLDAIAVTARPGLMGSLLVGVTAAKALAWSWNKPLVDVHHIQAHAYAALMALPDWNFPYITLIASGGHTSLYQTDSPRSHTLLGCTRDDAAGEALDKAAAMLDLDYPGGPSIEKAAADGNPKTFHFKRPLLAPDSLEFSFSGLKTALLYKLKGPGGKRKDPTQLEPGYLADLSASFEQAVMETLAKKCLRACQQTGIQQILVGGGVARNQRLRRILPQLATPEGITTTFAAPEACTDNATMIAGLGYALFQSGHQADLHLDVSAGG